VDVVIILEYGEENENRPMDVMEVEISGLDMNVDYPTEQATTCMSHGDN
jgi:hypothetical protein